MGFMESYKHLEKICGEVLNNDRKISAYIDEMEKISRFTTVLPQGWTEDLQHLKRYRRIRNQIAHTPDCTEENMCNVGDVQWLEDFYSRIMNQTDPLALHRKQTESRKIPPKTQFPNPNPSPLPKDPPHTVDQNPPRRPSGCLAVLLGCLLVFASVILSIILLS